jgi:hypothetical protein
MAEENPTFIIPSHKLIIAYDIRPSAHDNYFRFVMNELVPALQEKGLYMTEGWHTAYGDYPLRMLIFVAEELELIQSFLDSSEWADLHNRFQNYVRNFSVSVVPYRKGFQIVR